MKVKEKLSMLEVKPSKGKGQNFLIDESVIDQVVRFGDPQPDEALLEIGPGLGALTAELVKCGPLVVIEIEPKFCADLTRKFPMLQVVQADIRTVDFRTLKKETSFTVFGNLPYSFSTEILFHLIDQRDCIKRAILMLQREFAERVASKPGGREYGIISIMVQLFADVFLGPVIPGNSFHPPTRVDSILMELRMLPSIRFPVRSIDMFRHVVKGSFAQRRKKILNSLRSTGRFKSEQLERAFSETGIDPGRRAETLSIEEFYKLSEAITFQLP